MPNLVGIYDPGLSDDARDAIADRMAKAVDIPGFGFVQRRARGGKLSCINVLTTIEDNLSQPVKSSEGDWLMIDGEVLNREELDPQLDLPENADDAQVAMAAWRRFGEGFFERLKGSFNLLTFTQSDETLRLITDPLGSRIMFIARDGERVTFANEAKAVVAGRPQPSRAGGQGLFDYMSSTGQQGRRTWIDGVELVAPGTVLTLPKQERRYFKLRFREGGSEMNARDHAALFASDLRRATKRSLRGSDRWPIAMTLSGGLDSRAVAVSVPSEHRPFVSITYGEADSGDVRYAKQIADGLGFDHHWVEPEREGLVQKSLDVFAKLDAGQGAPAGFFGSQVDRITWRAEHMMLFHGLGSAIWHPLWSRQMRFMLNGAAGDAMTGSHLSVGLLLKRKPADAERQLRASYFNQDQNLLKRVLNPTFYSKHAPNRAASFAETFKDIEQSTALGASNVWDMENRQRHGAFMSFTMERHFCTLRTPFLDIDLADTLCRVPERWRFQQHLYKRMMVEHHPVARDVPWAYVEAPMSKHRSYEFAREVANFAKDRLRQKLKPNDTSSRWDFRDHNKMMAEDKALYDYVMAFTERHDFPSDVLDAPGVRSLAEDFVRAPDHDHANLYAHIVGLAKAHEHFLAADTIEIPAKANPSNFDVLPASSA